MSGPWLFLVMSEVMVFSDLGNGVPTLYKLKIE